MRNLFVVLGLVAMCGMSQAADGVVDMTWDGCTGPLNKIPPPQGPLFLYLTVTGIDQLHKAYDVRFIYGNAAQQVPDAWRFDVDGCEGSTLIAQNVFSKACPAFMQAGTGNLQIRKVEFSPPTDPYVTTLMRVLLANAYAPVPSTNPGTTYLLEEVKFDLTYAVAGVGDPPNTCGGLEQELDFKVNYASYLDLNGIEVPFGRARNPLQVSVDGSVPARPTTWGAIRAQYRH